MSALYNSGNEQGADTIRNDFSGAPDAEALADGISISLACLVPGLLDSHRRRGRGIMLGLLAGAFHGGGM